MLLSADGEREIFACTADRARFSPRASSSRRSAIVKADRLLARRKCLPEPHARRRLVEMQRIDRRPPRVRLVQHEHARMRRLVLRLDRPASHRVRLPDEQKAMELLLRQQRRILRGSDVRKKEGTQENGRDGSYAAFRANHASTSRIKRASSWPSAMPRRPSRSFCLRRGRVCAAPPALPSHGIQSRSVRENPRRA